MHQTSPKLDPSWLRVIKDEFDKPYMKQVKSFLAEEIGRGATFYPEPKNIFHALDSTPFDDVKVVILGQDPYHGPGQAHGLCFSVPDGIPKPPSLQNIFKELKADLDISVPKSGNLDPWAKRGVLLLNAILTVRADQPASHSKIGWGVFTDTIISKISEKRERVVFMLWGAFAQSKEPLIDGRKHLILKAAHPSPLSSSRGFFGCRHFSKTNRYLQENGESAIDWRLE